MADLRQFAIIVMAIVSVSGEASEFSRQLDIPAFKAYFSQLDGQAHARPVPVSNTLVRGTPGVIPGTPITTNPVRNVTPKGKTRVAKQIHGLVASVPPLSPQPPSLNHFHRQPQPIQTTKQFGPIGPQGLSGSGGNVGLQGNSFGAVPLGPLGGPLATHGGLVNGLLSGHGRPVGSIGGHVGGHGSDHMGGHGNGHARPIGGHVGGSIGGHLGGHDGHIGGHGGHDGHSIAGHGGHGGNLGGHAGKVTPGHFNGHGGHLGGPTGHLGGHGGPPLGHGGPTGGHVGGHRGHIGGHHGHSGIHHAGHGGHDGHMDGHVVGHGVNIGGHAGGHLGQHAGHVGGPINDNTISSVRKPLSGLADYKPLDAPIPINNFDLGPKPLNDDYNQGVHGLQVLGGSGVHGRPGVGGLGYAGHQGLEDGTLIGGGVGGQPIGGVGSAGLAPGLKNPSLVGAGVGDGLVGGGLVGGVSPGAVGGGLGLGGPVVHTQSEILPYDVTGGVGVVDKFIDDVGYVSPFSYFRLHQPLPIDFGQEFHYHAGKTISAKFNEFMTDPEGFPGIVLGKEVRATRAPNKDNYDDEKEPKLSVFNKPPPETTTPQSPRSFGFGNKKNSADSSVGTFSSNIGDNFGDTFAHNFGSNFGDSFETTTVKSTTVSKILSKLNRKPFKQSFEIPTVEFD